MTTIRSACAATSAEVVGDQHDRGVPVRLQALQQLHDLGLHGDVERGRRLVGDEHLRVVGQGHRDHRALPHAAGELVRVLPRPQRRGWGCRPRRAGRRPAAAPRPADVRACVVIISAIWSPTRNTGFSAVSGSWKIIARSRPRMRALLGLGHVEQRAALQEDRAGAGSLGGLGTSPMTVIADTDLPGARLADDRERLARVDVPAHPVDGLDHAGRGVEVHAQVAYLEPAGPMSRRRQAGAHRCDGTASTAPQPRVERVAQPVGDERESQRRDARSPARAPATGGSCPAPAGTASPG